MSEYVEPKVESTRKWYQSIGPGLITACVVIGPGSILTSSKVGAKNGFDLTWIVVLSVVFMMAFMQMGARLGAVLKESPGTVIARRAGRWLAACEHPRRLGHGTPPLVQSRAPTSQRPLTLLQVGRRIRACSFEVAQRAAKSTAPVTAST